MTLGAFLLISLFTFHVVSCQSFPNTVNPIRRVVRNENLLRNLYKTDYPGQKEDEYDPSFDDYYYYPNGDFGLRHFKYRNPVLSYGGSWTKRSKGSNTLGYGSTLGNNEGRYSKFADATRDWLFNYIGHTFTKRRGNGQRRVEDLLRLAGRI